MDRDELLDLLASPDYRMWTVAKVSDDVLYRSQIEIDEYTTVEDFEGVYGRLEWVRRQAWREWTDRPASMDGNAEILERDRDGVFWWQPPADVRRTDPLFRNLRADLRDIFEHGFIGVIVERCEGTDAYGHPIPTGVESLWGIECTADAGYIRHVVGELLSALEIEETVQ